MVCFHQFIYAKGTGITIRFVFLDIVVEIVCMERAEQAAACPGFQAPNVLVVGVAIRPGPAHFDKGILIFENGLSALLGPVPFLPHNTHMQIVSVNVQR